MRIRPWWRLPLFLLPCAFAATAPLFGTPVDKYGQLQVLSGQLCDSRGTPVQLKGMSTMGLQWYGGIVNEAAFAALAKDWNVDVIRLAMYVGEDGYATHPELKQLVIKGVNLAIAQGIYVIIDWHILTPGNPNDPLYAGAAAFFKEMSGTFGKTPNVIYEIMNEPNGRLSWKRDLKPYAQKIVSVIRANDPDNIILIGSGTWSQEVDVAASDPVPGRNLMYTVHFYSGTHGEELRQRIRAALSKGAAVFCSEWGTSEASGDGGPYIDAAEGWLKFLDEKKISWVNWSLANKNETSAAFKALRQVYVESKGLVVVQEETPLAPATQGADGIMYWPQDQLSVSGSYVRAKIRGEPLPVYSVPIASWDLADDPGTFKKLPWDFEDGSRQGWTVTADSPAQVKLTVSRAETQALTFSYGWKNPGPEDPWNAAPRISSSFVELPAADYSTLTFDVYFKAGAATTGSLQVQPVIQSPQHGYWFQMDPCDVDLTAGKAVSGGLLKYSFRVPLKSKGKPMKADAVIKNLILITVGLETDYQGTVQYDNIDLR